MRELQATLAELLPEAPTVVDVQSVSGGCISDAMRVSVSDAGGRSRTLFVKRNDSSFLDNFRCESAGLDRLAESDEIRVPRVVACGEVDRQAWLVTEWIEPGSRGRNAGSRRFYETFGRQLAELHRSTSCHQIGLEQDNYLGAARQINTACETWAEFVAEHRIGFQLKWATDQGVADLTLREACERIIGRIDRLLEGRDDSSCLLHGDLWSGNYLSDGEGLPVIIDPAIYYGCREAEFGMLKLFGSCPTEFYEAYQSAWPMPDGWQRRVSLYVLYHLLNHLNLFGRGYHGQCRSVAAEILSS